MGELDSQSLLYVRRVSRDKINAKISLSNKNAINAFEEILQEKISKLIGKNKTFSNLTELEASKVEEIIQTDKELLKYIDLVESTSKNSTPEFGTINALAYNPSVGDCEYQPNWPGWVQGEDVNVFYYYADATGRVKNDPNEAPCDYWLRIDNASYLNRVTGYTNAAQCVVNQFGGFSSNSARNKFIIGWARTAVCGVYWEWYLQKYLFFRY